jgi:AmmeMemoRadiSam system protein A
VTLSTDDQQRLLALARLALEARVRRDLEPVADVDGALTSRCAAFVTIHNGEILRGCLGRVSCDLPLAGVVVHLAAAVADSDPRFPPVDVLELDALQIEISVLTRAREIATLDQIEIGRHGLIVERGSLRGLLLPQVATEHGWTPEQFVEHTCVKAGLARDAWRHGARLSAFEAQVFGEASAILA